MASRSDLRAAADFLAIAHRGIDASFCIAGIPFDIGTTNRSGARFGPAAIRHASRMLVDGDHPHWWIDPAALSVADIGDFRIALGDIPKSLSLIEEQAASLDHLIALGGDHTVTLPLLRAAANRRGSPLALVHFDAHVDTWPDDFGQRYAHGSVFFHAIEERLIDPRHAVQIGIRSPVQKAVYDWTIARGVTIITAQDVHELGPSVIAERVGSGRRRRASIPQFRHRCARSRFRTGHRNAGDRRSGELANTGDPAPPRELAFHRHGSSSRWRRPMMSLRSQLSLGPRLSGNIWLSLGRASYAAARQTLEDVKSTEGQFLRLPSRQFAI